ncbi:unnamed protein product [Orchesella dallaii]|uniref:Uncharacterized protein n=1 Tax=Orchesella dallaii TaxID=48710 RepID=A0ABP1RMV4_9HEXA
MSSMTSQEGLDKDKEMSLNSEAVVMDPINNKKEDESQDKTPSELYAEILKLVKQPNATFQFAVFECCTVAFGSYAMSTRSPTFGVPVAFTELGIVVNFLHRRDNEGSDTIVGICIPFNTISDILVNWNDEYPVLFISVSPQIAEWVRQVLDMDGDPENGTGRYFCPDSEHQFQKMILLELTQESGAAKDNIAKLQTIYKDKLNEISSSASSAMLMSMMVPLELRAVVGEFIPNQVAP